VTLALEAETASVLGTEIYADLYGTPLCQHGKVKLSPKPQKSPSFSPTTSTQSGAF
jgi:hypothetical protein